MSTITEDMKFRQALLKCAAKIGVRRAARKYKTNKQYVYRWRKRWDGTVYSLWERSRRPKSHPNAHTAAEEDLIAKTRENNPNDGLVVFWVKLRRLGYTRSIVGLWRFMNKQNIKRDALPNPKYVPKPYEAMAYPGQRIQIDVKFVPKACLNGCPNSDMGYFQYTAIDECTRWRYVEGFNEHNTFASTRFLEHLIKAFPFPIECVQTDNGNEFTNRFTSDKGKLTMFEMKLAELGIRHKLIRPYTPRHNGKVERSHRKDNERFYAGRTFSSFGDFRKSLHEYNHLDYNNFPMRPLGWKTPQEVLDSFMPAV
jgi:transposase InsO family protein